jgi:hypothetical protein
MTTDAGRSATRVLLALLAPTLAGLGLAHCSSSSGGGQGTAADAGADGPSVKDPRDASAPDDTGEAQDSGIALEAQARCDAADACGGSLSCCATFCVDTRRDPRNCGACGSACTTTQFCTGTTCDEAVFTNVCANSAATVVNDPYPVDIEAGVALGQALASCTDAGFTLAIVPQMKPTVLIPVGDAGERPNTGVGDTLVAGGSWWGQLAVAYMDSNQLTPVYLTNDGTTSIIFERTTGLPLVTTLDSALTAQHDYFFLALAVEPQSGTLCFFGEGILSPGTVAAGYYGSQVLVPNHAAYPASYYVYEWTDTNNDGAPDAGDTFKLVAQGS